MCKMTLTPTLSLEGEFLGGLVPGVASACGGLTPGYLLRPLQGPDGTIGRFLIRQRRSARIVCPRARAARL